MTPTLKRLLARSPEATSSRPRKLLEDLVKSLIRRACVVSDTKRVLVITGVCRTTSGATLRCGGVLPPRHAEVSVLVLHGRHAGALAAAQGTKVTHAWTGNVAFVFYFLLHGP